MTTGRLRAIARRIDELLDATDVSGVPDADVALVVTTIAAVRSGGAAALDAATPHLWAYYRDVAADVGTGINGAPAIDAGGDIWDHVELARPPVASSGGRPLEPSPCYLSFEGEVSWEPEHGLQLVFDHRGAVCTVGPYDGHVTTAAAHGDPAMLGTIYM